MRPAAEIVGLLSFRQKLVKYMFRVDHDIIEHTIVSFTETNKSLCSMHLLF